MPPESSDDRLPLIAAFRSTLQDCADVYRAAAEHCIGSHPELVKKTPDAFRELMCDLHRGLVTKLFVELAYVDNRLDEAERRLAVELIDCLWARRLDDDQLCATLRQLTRSSARLSWSSLVGPFRKLPPLREFVGDVETVTVRLAHLIAKIDGTISPVEVERLKTVQSDLLAALTPKGTTIRRPSAQDNNAADRAVRKMADDAAHARPPGDEEIRAANAPRQTAPPKSLDAILAELEALIGLDAIKQDVQEMTNFLRMQQERKRLGLPATDVSLHMVFEGNPGTGKTTVARIVAQIFGAMGILKKGHLIETDRSGLVARYAGQTGPKTNQTVDEALDGVLFIDEAYSLVAEGNNDPYGAEAVQTLLKRMEDDRLRLAVVLAGYPAPMERLLKSNPGLSSRFNRRLVFPDYTAAELGRIMQCMCEKHEYDLPGATRGKLLIGFQHLLDRRDEHFGNGRLVRNVFEKAIRRLANRVVGVAPLSRETLTVLEPADIVLPDMQAADWRRLLDAGPRFEVSCPGCQRAHRVDADLLGRRVECNGCTHRFRVDWGAVVRSEQASQ